MSHPSGTDQFTVKPTPLAPGSKEGR